MPTIYLLIKLYIYHYENKFIKAFIIANNTFELKIFATNEEKLSRNFIIIFSKKLYNIEINYIQHKTPFKHC